MVVLTSQYCVPVWQSGVANTRTRRLTPVASAATIATKPKPNTAQPLSIGPSLVDQVLFKDQRVVIGDGRAFRGSESGKEVGILMERLERVAEGMREMELEKLMGRVRGQISDEERVLVERMSREIVSEFMEKPIQYLKRRDVEMAEKLNDLNFLAGILEESYFPKEKDKQSYE
ncbi:hypothetical protein RHSIM_Rhsim01G0275900 [Rhododendron simsii]|uniref:Tetrapyrrole biosynthesis glutamyl-tRNA reductase dimerisation domain-containing protein n=1 Tax=Rhododendron simsii TaxID=118357 RepID=A0A834HJ65_RHOSS|nr:hypothetical protein RHSIM_Rhsim01G0275900 [Rhododendron simsii]